MRSPLKFATFILLVGILDLLSCKKEISCENCNKSNHPPIANAGPDQVITLPTDSTSLDGNASNDPDGKISEWLWTKISGPASLAIAKSTDSTTKIKALVTGIYQFELKVTDNGGLFAKDTVQITVNDLIQSNRSPVANAGLDQTITLPTNTITLNGTGSTDPDNNITNYSWTKISGPSSFNITNANSVQTQVINLIEGVYQLELKVTDARGLFSKDTMQATVNRTSNDSCAASRPLINAQLVPFGILSQGGGPVTVASSGNKIVFAGGWNVSSVPTIGEATSRVDIYDTLTHTWSTAELSIARSGMAVAVSGNKIFFAGGGNTDGATWSTAYSNIDIYDVSTNTWSLDSLSGARSGVTGAAVGNKVFFAGGCCPYSNIVDIYDLASNSWSHSTLSEAKTEISAVTLHNKIYFAGGQRANNTVSKTIDIYDNATASWSASSLIDARAAMASIAFGDKIYWAGGGSPASTTNRVEIQNVRTQTSSLACLFQPNLYFGAAVKDNKIVFFTGETAAVKNRFDIYDPVTNTWSVGVLDENISGASILSVNNTIYVAGGNVNNRQFNGIWKLDF